MSAIDDLTNRPGHDLTLGIDQHSKACTVLTGQRLGDQALVNQAQTRQRRADQFPLVLERVF